MSTLNNCNSESTPKDNVETEFRQREMTTDIFEAVKAGNLNAIKQWIKSGVDVNIKCMYFKINQQYLIQ